MIILSIKLKAKKKKKTKNLKPADPTFASLIFLQHC